MTTVLRMIDINFCQQHISQRPLRNANAYFLLKCYFLMRGQAILTFQKPPSTDLVNIWVTFSELLFWSSELLEASGFLYPTSIAQAFSKCSPNLFKSCFLYVRPLTKVNPVSQFLSFCRKKVSSCMSLSPPSDIMRVL